MFGHLVFILHLVYMGGAVCLKEGIDSMNWNSRTAAKSFATQSRQHSYCSGVRGCHRYYSNMMIISLGVQHVIEYNSRNTVF